MWDMVRTNRSGKNYAVLPPADVLSQMLEDDENLTQAELARRYGVSYQAVSKKLAPYRLGMPREPYLPFKVRTEHGKRSSPNINAVCYMKWQVRGEEVTAREIALAKELMHVCETMRFYLAYNYARGFHYHKRRDADQPLILPHHCPCADSENFA